MRILLGIFIIILCFGSNSCQKEFTISDIDSSLFTTPIDPAVTGDFTANINGVQFVADKAAAATRTLNIIAITGQDNSGQTIVLRVADSGVHVYTLDIQSASNAGAYTEATGAVAYATNGGNTSDQSGGTLSITSIDTVNKRISGTFSIKVYRQTDLTQKNITEGKFNNISYGTQALPPANSTDTFRVKVDGVDFPGFSIDGISVFGMTSVTTSDQAVSKTIGLTFPSTITPGTYNFDLFQYVGQYNIGSTILQADNGSFTIIEYNTTTKRIRGNFSFHASQPFGTGTQTANLTEGYFSVIYQ